MLGPQQQFDKQDSRPYLWKVKVLVDLTYYL